MTETISSVTTTDVVLDEDARRGLAGQMVAQARALARAAFEIAPAQ